MQKKVEHGLVEHISSFIDIWNGECRSTEKILKCIPEDLLNKRLIPDYRTLGGIAWHLIQSPKEMLGHTGLKIEGPEESDPVPKTLQEIIQAHETVWHSVKEQLATQWNDSMLRLVDEVYGEQWERSFTLTALLFHLSHHRGQMTTLLRLGKAPVKGVCGPAKEEWAAYGLPAPSV